jgi:hypothetical protein
MTDVPDARLLEQFARNGSEEAFAALVQRHIALVHSVALRHTANPQHADLILLDRGLRLRHRAHLGLVPFVAGSSAKTPGTVRPARVNARMMLFMTSTIMTPSATLY